MLTVGTIVNGGFRLVRERPFSVAIWGLIYMAGAIAGFILVLGPLFAMQAGMMGGGEAGPPNPLAMMGVVYLFDFGILFLLMVLMAAGLRAVLRPEESGFAFIRLGMDELRLFGLMLIFLVGFMVLSIAFAILFAIVLGATGAMSGGYAPAEGSPFGRISWAVYALMLGFYALLFWLQVRLSPTIALTMIRQKIIIGEAWRLSRGHFWTMFGGFLVLGLILGAGYLAILFAVFAPFIGDVTRGTLGMDTLAAIQQGNFASLGGFGFMLILGAVGIAILAGIGIAFWSGGIATATAALLEEDGEGVAAAFE
jgi:hypothetical protein